MYYAINDLDTVKSVLGMMEIPHTFNQTETEIDLDHDGYRLLAKALKHKEMENIGLRPVLPMYRNIQVTRQPNPASQWALDHQVRNEYIPQHIREEWNMLVASGDLYMEALGSGYDACVRAVCRGKWKCFSYRHDIMAFTNWSVPYDASAWLQEEVAKQMEMIEEGTLYTYLSSN